MKHLLTLTALLVSSLAMAQMPYNPDSNGDDLIGSEDLLTFLGVYNTTLMQPDLQCNYEGTDLEQLFGGLIAGSLILDSVYVEYLFSDSILTFNPECPDPIYEEVVLERSYMLTGTNVYGLLNDKIEISNVIFGYPRRFFLSFDYDYGTWSFYMTDAEAGSLTNAGDYSYPDLLGQSFTLPFQESWSLDENGIQWTWSSTNFGFAANCDYYRLIPFWHEAE